MTTWEFFILQCKVSLFIGVPTALVFGGLVGFIVWFYDREFGPKK